MCLEISNPDTADKRQCPNNTSSRLEAKHIVP